MAILSEVNGEQIELKDEMVDLAFDPIKRQLARDSKRWDEVSEKRKQAANARWEMQKDANASKSSDLHYDTVTDTVTVNGNEKREENTAQKMIRMWKDKRKTFSSPYVWDASKDTFHINSLRAKIDNMLRQINGDPHFPVAEEKILQSWNYIISNLNDWWKTQDLAKMNADFNKLTADVKKTDEIKKSDQRRALS